jgi:hypothetical protein
VFNSGGSITDAAYRARCIGADYLLIDKKSGPYQVWVEHPASFPQGAMVMENRDAVLLRTLALPGCSDLIPIAP